ncbi:hypothetical protein [Mesorhizobium wenxiniae]|uniref:hypothetical protein n=1 Tax=Mesorhizobium wenxiniae TaxID=2014805 RepID=UPI001FD9949B|nr:hypothetical protein [Mesorhizobium wenxiniae]
MTIKTVTRNRFARASDHSLVPAARRHIRDTGDATMNITLNPEGSDLSPYLPDEHGLFFVYHFTAKARARPFPFRLQRHDADRRPQATATVGRQYPQGDRQRFAQSSALRQS